MSYQPAPWPPGSGRCLSCRWSGWRGGPHCSHPTGNPRFPTPPTCRHFEREPGADDQLPPPARPDRPTVTR